MVDGPQESSPVVPHRRRDARPDDLCTCGHPRDAHEHYRAGSDCGACGSSVCPAFTAVAVTGDAAETA